MPTAVKPLAVCCADLHLTLAPPACRAEKNWKRVQRQALEQLTDIAKGLPILCSGDIFDKWNVSPELINFALRYLPTGMICVPGQHDLPNHRIADVHRSGYGVLMSSGKIQDISSGRVYQGKGFCVYGFGWEEELKKPEVCSVVSVALIHRYFWTSAENGYPGAPLENQLDSCWDVLKHYQTVIAGDNHKDFSVRRKGWNFFNCGGFLRRKSDEKNRCPRVGIVYSDGTIKPVLLDVAKDRFHLESAKEEVANLHEFLESLKQFEDTSLCFPEMVKKLLREKTITPGAKNVIREIMELQ